jgi:hypothetical protein
MEYDSEPIPGLPGVLPKGESILWQGSPDWVGLAERAFHVRGISVYFGLLLLLAIWNGSTMGVLFTIVGGAAGVGLLFGLAWLSARSTIYTITNRRVVMRYGIALPKAINLPFSQIGGAAITRDRKGRADIPLQLTGKHRLGYLQFWPHARAWKLAQPEPMLRSLVDGEDVAKLLFDRLIAAQPIAPAQGAALA